MTNEAAEGLTTTHVGVHWCSLESAACLGMQYREERPRLIASIRANIAHHQQMIRRERKRLAILDARRLGRLIGGAG
jgi:hypothetical protein